MPRNPRNSPFSVLNWTIAAGALALGVIGSSADARHQPASYVTVQRIFTAHCVRCHGGGVGTAGLQLDTFANVLKGSAAGKVVAPGDPGHSVLIHRIRGDGGKPQMPPGFAPLTESEQKTIADWIAAGAPGPDGKTHLHWAYVKPQRPPLPNVRDPKWVRNPIDAFVLARLEKEGLKPSPEADKTTLVRRVTLDLTGLPPTPEEVDAYISDKSPKAYERLLDRLFASPHYGEKMALPWLDAARYADSNGFQMDGDTYQYVWRDWVVRALNADMPFDRFTVLQIAGDLLPGVTQATPEGRDALVATAFNRDHMLNGEGGAIPEEQRNVGLFDRVETMSTTWLGLTMTCTRCHDHKYDPFTQRDYYSLMAYFNNVPETGVPEGGVPYSVASPWIYAGDDAQMRQLFALESKAAIAASNKSPDAEALKKQLDALKAQIPRVMVMSERAPRQTHVLNRGNYEEPLDPVGCDTPLTLPRQPKESPKNRFGLAEWIVSPENPLTARVQVNRAWQTFFGQGLVKTQENFGVQGSPPSHPELLDWLAVEFAQGGWDVKKLQRLILTSATYRQSSKTSPTLEKRDPDNELLARGARFRLPSMLLRDVALAASGLVDLRIGGKPVYPYQPKGIWDGLAITDERDFSYPQSHGPDLYRRSLYTFWRRTVVPGNMFDAATRNVCTVRQWVTSTPLHALTTLNDVTWVEAGRALAQRVMLAKKTPEERLTLAFRYVCARRPDAQELAVLKRGLQRALDYYKKDPGQADAYLALGESARDKSLDTAEHAAYATVCLTILNLDEALTKE